MKQDAFLYLQTDVMQLFEEYCVVLDACPYFERDKQDDSTQNAMYAKSHREKKCEENGVYINRGMWRKK